MAASGRKLNPLALASPAVALGGGGFKKKKPTDPPGGGMPGNSYGA